MSARDDYPILHAKRMFDEGSESRRALDEIDTLRSLVSQLEANLETLRNTNAALRVRDASRRY